jgi:hypothetical protein
MKKKGPGFPKSVQTALQPHWRHSEIFFLRREDLILILIGPKSKLVEFCGLRSTDQFFGTPETVVIFLLLSGFDHSCQMTAVSGAVPRTP